MFAMRFPFSKFSFMQFLKNDCAITAANPNKILVISNPSSPCSKLSTPLGNVFDKNAYKGAATDETSAGPKNVLGTTPGNSK